MINLTHFLNTFHGLTLDHFHVDTVIFIAFSVIHIREQQHLQITPFRVSQKFDVRLKRLNYFNVTLFIVPTLV